MIRCCKRRNCKGKRACCKIDACFACSSDTVRYIGEIAFHAVHISVRHLSKGAGHFESTSFFTGNTAIAAHNRGVSNHFGKIHTLDLGDIIKLTTKLGTRTYEVYSVSKISNDDLSVLNDSKDDIITLITCVRDQPDYRWCVQAIAE